MKVSLHRCTLGAPSVSYTCQSFIFILEPSRVLRPLGWSRREGKKPSVVCLRVWTCSRWSMCGTAHVNKPVGSFGIAYVLFCYPSLIYIKVQEAKEEQFIPLYLALFIWQIFIKHLLWWELNKHLNKWKLHPRWWWVLWRKINFGEREAECREADCPLETHCSWAASQEGCHLSKDLKAVRRTYMKSWIENTINYRVLNVRWYSSTQGTICNCVGVCWLSQWLYGGRLEEEALLWVISWWNQGSSMFCHAQDSHGRWRWVQQKCQ